jgi:hypothetical protein
MKNALIVTACVATLSAFMAFGAAAQTGCHAAQESSTAEGMEARGVSNNGMAKGSMANDGMSRDNMAGTP